MDIVESLKLILNNPNVAYLLLILSILGISIEILTPGLIFPSTIGILLGILAFFGLSSLGINFLGLTLIILSLAFFIAEAVFKKKGLIAVFGAAVILTGSFFLFKGGIENQANPFLIIGTTLVISAILTFLSNRIAFSQLKSISTGRESIKDGIAVVRSELNPDGMVFYQGELWNARLDEGKADLGEEVIIKNMEGLKLFVAKKRR
jgi:membrane-bound serine protease (ClpP class)